MGGLLGNGCYAKSSTAPVLKSLSRLHTANLTINNHSVFMSPDSHGLMAQPPHHLKGLGARV